MRGLCLYLFACAGLVDCDEDGELAWALGFVLTDDV